MELESTSKDIDKTKIITCVNCHEDTDDFFQFQDPSDYVLCVDCFNSIEEPYSSEKKIVQV